MDGSLPFWVLGGVAMLLSALLVSALFRRGRLQTLRAVAGLLEDAERVDDEAVAGMFDGWAFEIRLTQRSEGEHVTSWTEVTVEHDLDAHLSLRPQTWMEERHIEAGRTIDLQTGDEAFDERFVVEGAPSERVLRALDSEMIQDLMEHPLLVGVETPEAGTLTLSFRHWLSAAHVEDAMILAWNLTQALSGELESSPYRSPAKPPTDDAGRSELEAVARARSERAVHQKEAGRVFLVVGLCVGACVLLAAWAYISS